MHIVVHKTVTISFAFISANPTLLRSPYKVKTIINQKQLYIYTTTYNFSFIQNNSTCVHYALGINAKIFYVC